MKAETAWPCTVILAICLSAGMARAGDRTDDVAGDFTHYVLALSWNASWCAREGEARDAAPCDPRHHLGFTLHGLWPQGDEGWPEYCLTRHADPSRAETAAMADIMGSGGLAWYQWKKHGRCAGLTAAEYFALARAAFGAVEQPQVLEQLERPVRIDPDVIEEAFLKANPGLAPDQLAVTCKGGLLQEVRVCLTRDLEPRACTAEVERGCRASSIELPPVR
ncbi:MAG TPA: ribonuclease T2 [Paracoccaceae bacterium]|nr:ribonuclease T2 [Paracoccaceae bacterium]